MYNNETVAPSRLQNFWDNATTTGKLAVIIIPLGMIIILVISIVYIVINSVPADARHVDIENFSEVAPNVPNFYRYNTQSNLWYTLQSIDLANDDTHIKAKIRDNTYRETFIEDGIYNSEFIVDIPEVEQSFTVDFDWHNTNSPDEYDVVIGCPTYTDVIYKNTYCSLSGQPFDILSQYLPASIDYDKGIMLFQSFYRNYKSATAEQPYLRVSVESCAENFNTAPYQTQVYKWLREHYVDPESINIEYSQYCPTSMSSAN